jgi:alpha-tubulin suppressor-like RCC1 family protein
MNLSSTLNVGNGCSVLAVTTGGALWVWGNNAGGQLAIGGTSNQLTPTLASGLSGLTVIKAMFSGGQNGVAAPGGTTRMHVLTSNGSFGSLRTAGVGGRGFGNGLNQPNTTSFVTAFQNGVSFDDFRVYGTWSNSVILCRGTDGNLYSFGANDNNMAGQNTGVWATLPAKINFY